AVFILRMRQVHCVDATGLHALMELHEKCRRGGTQLVLSGVNTQPRLAMTRAGLDGLIGIDNICGSISHAVARAEVLTAELEPRR
ncbi:MAG: sodium-independent anion transporter, partial [Phycisphaerales bacterium]|nr:sodium-independent anion transporter [Phycisphaerales bacterium]